MAENPRTPWEYEFPQPPVSVPEGDARTLADALADEIIMHDRGSQVDLWIHEDGVALITAALLSAESRARSAPIDMILYCPACGLQHVDEPDERTPDWSNPPHRSHLCHGCKHIWRPADVPTNGVSAIKTAGKADSPAPPSLSSPEEG